MTWSCIAVRKPSVSANKFVSLLLLLLLLSLSPLCSVFIHVYGAGDKIEKNEMGWACGSYGGGEGGV